MDLSSHEDLPASLPMGSSRNGIHQGVIISSSKTEGKLKIASSSANSSPRSNGLIGAASAHVPSNGGAPHMDNINSAHQDVRLPSSLELKGGRKSVKYRECLKNHAASLGGHATDGCGEFMPSGEEGTLEALQCAACACHRNFHRREVEGDEIAHQQQQQLQPRSASISASCDCRGYGKHLEPIFAPPPSHIPPLPALPPPPQMMPPTAHMLMAFNQVGPPPTGDSDEFDGPGFASTHSQLRKRFRTKFTAHQKERMWEFSEKLGWRIQKHDEDAVLQFCADAGVKRHVLKVWMHNNKNTLGKKPSSSSSGVAAAAAGDRLLTDEDDDDLRDA